MLIIKNFERLNKRELLKKFFTIQSAIQSKGLKLTDLQIDILVLIMTLPEKFKYDVLSIPARAYIRQEYEKISEKKMTITHLIYIIGKLRDRGIFIKDEFKAETLHPKFQKLMELNENLKLEINFNMK